MHVNLPKWIPSDHPRDNEGKFTGRGGGRSSFKQIAQRILPTKLSHKPALKRDPDKNLKRIMKVAGAAVAVKYGAPHVFAGYIKYGRYARSTKNTAEAIEKVSAKIGALSKRFGDPIANKALEHINSAEFKKSLHELFGHHKIPRTVTVGTGKGIGSFVGPYYNMISENITCSTDWAAKMIKRLNMSEQRAKELVGKIVTHEFAHHVYNVDGNVKNKVEAIYTKTMKGLKGKKIRFIEMERHGLRDVSGKIVDVHIIDNTIPDFGDITLRSRKSIMKTAQFVVKTDQGTKIVNSNMNPFSMKNSIILQIGRGNEYKHRLLTDIEDGQSIINLIMNKGNAGELRKKIASRTPDIFHPRYKGDRNLYGLTTSQEHFAVMSERGKKL